MGRGNLNLGMAPFLLQLTRLFCHWGLTINLILSSFSLTSRGRPYSLAFSTNAPSSHLLQATEEPVVPAEPLESMLRPFNLVIPFTVQKGELTGNGCPTHKALLRTENTSWPFS